MSNSHDVAISHLQRRKIEGRVLIPFIETLRERLGEDATLELVDLTIRRLAVDDGHDGPKSMDKAPARCGGSPKNCGQAAAAWVFKLSASQMIISTST
jgi:hypothetical protein